jgi:vacuolar-type H+-ATPase subunit D/Vma8
MIEFEKKLQGAEEFEKLSQQLAQEIKKLKSRYNCLENALIETTGKVGGNVERYFKVFFSKI